VGESFILLKVYSSDEMENTCILWKSRMHLRQERPEHCFHMSIELPFGRNTVFLSVFQV
jgi:hypothetical protein